MSLFQIKFNERELITLRMIFNSNSGLNKIINSAISLDEIRSLSHENLKDLKFRKPEEILNKLQNYEFYESEAIDTIDWSEDNNISIISIFDKRYPKKLHKIKNPPCLLFCSGNVSLLSVEKSIAIVGSREVSDFGNTITERTTNYFSKNGVNIVSGLAKGVDTHAHETALKNTSSTIAVLVDIKTISPASNIKLAKEIIQNDGLIISENLPGTQASDAYLFIDRNRIQTGLSKLIIIIEAGADSGTKSTANHAIQQNIPIYCSNLNLIKNYPKSRFENSLNKKLFDQGLAQYFSAESYDEILSILENDS